MSILPKAIYMFNAISIKITPAFSSELEQTILTFVWNQKIAWMAKAILKKKTKAGGLTIPDFGLHYKALIIKTVWHWHKNRHSDQQNRRQNPDMDPQTYDQLQDISSSLLNSLFRAALSCGCVECEMRGCSSNGKYFRYGIYQT